MIKTIIVLFFAVLAGTGGDLLLSKGMRALNQEMSIHWGNFIPFFVRTFQSGTVWLGIGSMTIFFFLYLVALSRAEVSFVLPLTAFSYVLTALFAKYYLHENVNWIRLAGTVLIFTGVVMVALSSKSAKPVQQPQPTEVIAASPSTQHAD